MVRRTRTICGFTYSANSSSALPRCEARSSDSSPDMRLSLLGGRLLQTLGEGVPLGFLLPPLLLELRLAAGTALGFAPGRLLGALPLLLGVVRDRAGAREVVLVF